MLPKTREVMKKLMLELMLAEDMEPVQLQVTRPHLASYVKGWFDGKLNMDLFNLALQELIDKGDFVDVPDVEGEPGVQLGPKLRKIAYAKGKDERLRLGFPS